MNRTRYGSRGPRDNPTEQAGACAAQPGLAVEGISLLERTKALEVSEGTAIP
jgi:hypothetical protein